MDFQMYFVVTPKGCHHRANHVIPSGFDIRFRFIWNRFIPSGLCCYIRNTPKLFSSTAEFNTTDSANPKT
jgi:hypothetical protein